MQQIQPEDPSQAFTKEQHLSWMVCYIIGLFELVLNKHADILSLADLRLMVDASSHLPHLHSNEEDKQKSLDFLKSIGGVSLYQEIAYEVREWVFIYEPLLLRKSKERPIKKDDLRQDHRFLQEGFYAISDLFRRSAINIQGFLPDVYTDDISMGMLREYLKTGSCPAPIFKPEALAERYAPVFEKYQKRINDLHSKLGNFRNHVQKVDLQLVIDLGLSGLRSTWSQNPFIVDRIHLEFLGVADKANQIFKQAFITKIQSNISKQKQNDDGNLYHYVKLINDFFIDIKRSKDYQGTPEMEIALCNYINKEDFDA